MANFFMNEATQHLLANLDSAQWFSNCGALVSDEVIPIQTWDQVAQFGSRQAWDDIRLEAANDIGAAIQNKSWPRYCEWNNVVVKIKPLIEALAKRKCEVLGVPKEFWDRARWDILHAAIETEYADILMPGFFAKLAKWYGSGHFPCAWVGQYPEGKLVVF